MTVQLQKDTVKKHFNTTHAYWEDIYHQKDYESVNFQKRMKAGLDLCQKFIKPPAKILDIGCGCGHASISLAQAGYDVVGIDIAQKMIEQATDNAKKIDLKGSCEFYCYDFQTALQNFGAFDAVLGLGFIEYFDDPIVIMANIRELLEIGGIAVIQVHNKWRLPRMFDKTYTPLKAFLPQYLATKVAKLILPREKVFQLKKEKGLIHKVGVDQSGRILHCQYSPLQIDSYAHKTGFFKLDYKGFMYGPIFSINEKTLFKFESTMNTLGKIIKPIQLFGANYIATYRKDII